jgi:hypothetical protein
MTRAIIMNRFYLVLISAMAIYIIFLQACGGSNKAGVGVEYSTTSIIKMKVPRFTEVIKPVPVEVTTPPITIFDTIPYTDSTYCKNLASDYYTARVYNDTIQGDTCDLYVKARVYGNELDSVQLGYKLNIPLVTVQEYKPRIQVFVAGNVGTNLKGFVAGPELIVKDKRDFLYKAGVDFNTTGDIIYRVGFGFKLSFGKKPVR